MSKIIVPNEPLTPDTPPTMSDILIIRITDFITQFHFTPNVIFLNKEDYVQLADEGMRMPKIPVAGGVDLRGVDLQRNPALRPAINIKTFRGIAVKKSEVSCVALAMRLEMGKVEPEPRKET